MDLVTMYPQGMGQIITDGEIDEMESYYSKPIEIITSDEVDDWFELEKAIRLDRSFSIN